MAFLDTKYKANNVNVHVRNWEKNMQQNDVIFNFVFEKKEVCIISQKLYRYGTFLKNRGNRNISLWINNMY